MRLGILTQYYPPEIGAPQARLSELARRIMDRGHEVHVLTAMPNYPQGKVHPGYAGLMRRETLNGARLLRSWIYPSQSVSKIKRLSSYFSFVGSSFVAGTAFLPRLDALMVESPPLFLGFSGLGLSFLKRARLIFNVSDLWPESAVRLGLVGEGPALRASYRLEALCYRRSWLVTGQSRGILGDIEKRFPEVRTHLLTNGVDPALFHPQVPTPPARGDMGQDGECLAVYTGLHGVAQGLGQLLEAAALLRDLPNFRLVLVGDGPEKSDLQAKAESMGLANVRFLDPRPREAMPGLMAAADIAIACLVGTIPGAVPSKIYEAMGAAKPLLLVADGEPAEITQRTGCGLAVPPGDIPAIARALRTLALDSEKRRHLGQAGRRAAETTYSRERIASEFIDLLEKELPC